MFLPGTGWSSDRGTRRRQNGLTNLRRRSRLDALSFGDARVLNEVGEQSEAEQRQREPGPELMSDDVLGQELQQAGRKEGAEQAAPQAVDAAHDDDRDQEDRRLAG